MRTGAERVARSLGLIGLLVAGDAWAEPEEPGLVSPSALPEPAPVAAAAERYPNVRVSLSAEIQNDRAYHAQDRDRELNDLFATIEPAIGFDFSENWSLESSLVFEPVEDPDPHESREFDSHGLFVEELYVQWASENASLRAGKLNPHFGIAWDRAPGLYGVDFAEDYELTERAGLGGSYGLDAQAFGQWVGSVDVFTLDTSHLTRSIGRGRSRVRRSDGGPSNTGRLNSYAFELQGTEIPALPGLSYTLGLAYQDAGKDGRPERDYVLAAEYTRELRDETTLDLLAEYVVLDQADGEADRVRRYLTTSAALNTDPLVFALSYTLRDERVPQDRDNNDFLFQASVGYFRALGVGQAGFEVGWRLSREANRKVGIAGLRLSYTAEF